MCGMDRETFEQLRDEWWEDTKSLSTLSQIVMHKSYQKIIGGGRDSLPYIFQDMRERRSGQWFWALETITREDPVPEEDVGDIERTTHHWLTWAERNGYPADRDDGDPFHYPREIERVGFRVDGRLDEIVLGEFHLEWMQRDVWWFSIGGINCVCCDVQIDFVNYKDGTGRVPPGICPDDWE